MAASALVACSDNNDDNGKKVEEVDPAIAAIVGKWDISDPASRYASFEFQADGSYIVREYADAASASAARPTRVRSIAALRSLLKNPAALARRAARPASVARPAAEGAREVVVHVGKFTLTGTAIALTNLGTIADFVAGAEEFSFTFTPTGEAAIAYVAQKDENVDSSDQTALLCKMWKVTAMKLDISGMSAAHKALMDEQWAEWGKMVDPTGQYAGWQQFYQSIFDGFLNTKVDGKTVSLCVLFSNAGTFLTIMRDEAGSYYTEVKAESDEGLGISMSGGNGTWKWHNPAKTAIYWEDVEPDEYGYTGSGVLKVTELTSTSLKVEVDAFEEGEENDLMYGVKVIEEHVRAE
ncbi:MAG: hypothetical protein LBS63_00265 [Prevotellaceae bacterium]|nr:hypothetical protein [Prevotellaceae bacterium]